MILLFPLVIFFFFVSVICVIIGVTRVVAYQKRQERLFELGRFAAQNGWTFNAKNTPNQFQNANAYRIFNVGHSKQMGGFMQRQAQNGEQFFVFDYEYATGHGKSRRQYKQTIFAVRSAHLDLPYFALYPEGFFSFLGEMIGYNDIDFGSHPAFSKRYKLSGQNEAHIRHVFQPQILSRLEMAGNLNIDGGGNYLFVYWQGTAVKIANLNAFIGEGMNILHFFRR